jgi:acyl transferase domain-containing protein
MNIAYHSLHMESARERYERALEGIPHSPTSTNPMFSSVTGTLITPLQTTPSYWVDNLVSPVNFVGATRSLLCHESNPRKAFANLFLELGPYSALRSYLRDIFSGEDYASDFKYTTILRRKFDGAAAALEAMGKLWAEGCTVDVEKVNNMSPKQPNILDDLLPYSWTHKPYWDKSHLSR